MSAKPNQKKVLSLRVKLLLPLLALITIVFIVTYFGIQAYIKDTVFGNLDEETTAIIDYTTTCLDGDALQELIESGVQYDEAVGWPDGMTDPRYWELQECLASVSDFNPRTELFTYHAVEQGALAYGVDQWAALEPDNSYAFGEPIPEDDSDYSAYLLGLTAVYYYDDLEYAAEDEVYYYTTIVPIENSAGEVISGLVIYLDANWVTEGLQDLSNILLGIFAVIYIFIFLLVWVITRNATAQLAELQAAASRVADGDYTRITLKPQPIGDEVSSLTELFNIMLDKVRGREEKLKQEVVELKLQIDMEQRKKEVQEIVETEFFQDLKSKAATVRKKRQQNG